MNDNSPAGLFILLGIIGIGILIATRHSGRNNHPKTYSPDSWQLIQPGILQESHIADESTKVFMENEERTEYIRDDNGLIKEKIVHRKVIKHGQ